MSRVKRLLVTGGAGFLGSNFIRYLYINYKDIDIILNIDRLSYAADMQNVYEFVTWSKYNFIECDINNQDLVKKLIDEYDIDTIVHFAAETHVDNSIKNPKEFVDNNIVGTYNLLEAIRLSNKKPYLHYICTDEIFGSINEDMYANEISHLNPSSPYSATKASAYLLTLAYINTYGLAITSSNSCNIYGPHQHNEKLIPKAINNMIKGINIPIYGNGKQKRIWLYVDDHSEAVWQLVNKGTYGNNYNISGSVEICNISLIETLCDLMGSITNTSKNNYLQLITYVNDRLGHDIRYAIDGSKYKINIGSYEKTSFEDGLIKTISWKLGCIHN